MLAAQLKPFWGVSVFLPAGFLRCSFVIFVVSVLSINPTLDLLSVAVQIPVNIHCHAEGGATEGGRKKMSANANKRRQTQAKTQAKTQAYASKRGQTQTNAYTPLYCGFKHTPSAIPLNMSSSFS